MISVFEAATACLLFLAASVSFAGAPQTMDRLPASLERGPAVIVPNSTRPWNIADIVEVRRITDVAISEESHQVAFIVKQAFLDTDVVRYGLYLLEPDGHVAQKLAEASYIVQLSWHPNSRAWTVRADIGDGVQLYDVDVQGAIRPLLVISRTVKVGAADSLIAGPADEPPRSVGVASYEWAPDGSSFWYSTYRLRDPPMREKMAEEGVVFKDGRMDFHSFLLDATTVLGVELHCVDVASSQDHLLRFVPGGAEVGLMFSRADGSASWLNDSRHIRYGLWQLDVDGSIQSSAWSIDVASESLVKIPVGTIQEMFSSVPAAEGRGVLVVKVTTDGRRLVQMDGDVLVKDFGKVDFIGFSEELGSWKVASRHIQIVAVRYEDHYGLVAIRGNVVAQMVTTPDSLRHCGFSKDGRAGVCVRESMVSPPDLVDIRLQDGNVSTLVSVNPQYASLRRVDVRPVAWTNRYQRQSVGYLLGGISFGHDVSRPTVVVSHGHDALNVFASQALQWSFPLQLMADQGYLVAEVNEPQATAASRAASAARYGISSDLSTSDVQFQEAFNAVSSMEAALDSLVAGGLADPAKTAIVGYSRGAEIVEWTMTQSKRFHVAIEGDSGGYIASFYALNRPNIREYYRQLYGGSPFDEQARPNYAGLSVSFRSREFAGPLLQMFAQANAVAGLELHSLLRDAGIPSELVYFRNESHLFWNPRHQAAVMQRSLDWLDYWLLHRRNAGVLLEEYQGWESMAAKWNNHER